MANTLDKHYTDDINFFTNNDTWTLTADASIATDDYGFFGSNYTHNTVTVRGQVFGLDGAVYCYGENTRTVVAEGGMLSGFYGIYYSGQNSSATNNGSIFGYTGLYATAENIDFVNNGLMTTSLYGVYLTYSSDTFTNGKKGELHSGGYGIYMSGGASGEDTRTVNHGFISGDDYSYQSSGGDDTLVNDGRMVGDVSTSSGNDTLDTRGGRVQGDIELGNDDDTLYTDRAAYQLIESGGGGTDTVKSTVTYTLSDNVERLFLLGSKDIDGTGTALDDVLHGNAGDNILKGKAGMDHLYGHKGNDKLIGGADVDYFHFKTGNGDDVISDFQDAIDQIDLSGWAAITSLADLKNNHAHNQGADVIIEAGTDSLLIKGIHKADLDLVDFFTF